MDTVVPATCGETGAVDALAEVQVVVVNVYAVPVGAGEAGAAEAVADVADVVASVYAVPGREAAELGKPSLLAPGLPASRAHTE